MFRRAVSRIIESIADTEVVGEASDGLELLELLKKISPQLVIMDISIPNLQGLEATPRSRSSTSVVKVLILTMHKDKEYLYHAFSAGAEGYLLKEDADSELISAIETLRRGGIIFRHCFPPNWRTYSCRSPDPLRNSYPAAGSRSLPGEGDYQAHCRRQVQQRSGRSRSSSAAGPSSTTAPIS